MIFRHGVPVKCRDLESQILCLTIIGLIRRITHRVIRRITRMDPLLDLNLIKTTNITKIVNIDGKISKNHGVLCENDEFLIKKSVIFRYYKTF